MKPEIKISKVGKDIIIRLMKDNLLLFTYYCDSNIEVEKFIEIATNKG